MSEDKEIWLSSIETLNSTLNNLFQLINQSKLTQAELNNLMENCFDRYVKILRSFSEFAKSNSSDIEVIDLSDLNPTERLEKLRILLKTSRKTSLLTKLKKNGFTIFELREANLSLAELKEALFTATEAREAGYTLNQMKEAKYKLIELTKAGFTEHDLKNAGYDLNHLRSIRSYTVNESFDIGFTLKEIKKFYSFEEIYNSNLFSLSQYKEAGIPIDQIAAKFSPKELLEAKYPFIEVVKNKELKIEDLDSSISFHDAKTVFTLSQLKETGLYPLQALRNDFNASIEVIKESGYSALEAYEVGYKLKQIFQAKYPLDEILRIKKFSENELTQAGVNLESIPEDY